MNKIQLFIFSLLLSNVTYAQPTGYYNGTDGKKGTELKHALHEIIKGHVDYSYSQAKFLINYSDADPANPDNVILFYTQRSHPASDYGSGGNHINREHVWAKSHGNFSGIRPMDGDAFNLRPADASVNVDRTNNDFGNVKPNGTQHPEATECWYTSTKWEPGDATKGQVARIIFYMATRYEGTDGELDLEAVNGFDNYPNPTHGDLATLLEWNRKFPVSDFERRRNERIFSMQLNRNPFVDHPEFADLIWLDNTPNPIAFNNMQMTPQFPKAGESANISLEIVADSKIETAKIFWGKSYNSESNQFTLSAVGNSFSANIDLTGFQAEDMVYYKIVAQTTSNENITFGSFELPKSILPNDLVSIAAIQGTGDISPSNNTNVTFSGRIAANYDNTIYIQQGSGDYSGICIFGSLKTGKVGDSIVVTGLVSEYNNLTEITDVSYLYNFKKSKEIQPKEITVAEIGEKNEGMLVRIKNVSFNEGGVIIPDENKSYTFSDVTGSAIMYSRYSSRLLNKKLPAGVTDLVGVVSQYQSTYQILPRDINDFSAGVDIDAPKISNVFLLDKEWITIDFNEIVEKTSSEDLSNYTFSSGIIPIVAYRYEEGNAVVLQVSGMSVGTHTITINGIKDPTGNVMQNESFQFVSIYSDVHDLNASKLEVYPNPIIGNNVEITTLSDLDRIDLYSSLGQIISTKTVHGRKNSILIPTYRGVYFLKVLTSDGNVMTQKLVRQ